MTGMVEHGLSIKKDGAPGLVSLRIQDLRPAFIEDPESSQIYAKPDLSLDCRACLSFMAPSGRGKTTFARSLLGLPVRGSGRLDFHARTGNAVPGRDLASFVRSRFISVIPQDFKLIGHASVRTNIRLAQSAWQNLPGSSPKSLPDEQEILRMAEMLELETRLERQVQSLSRGEQQRAAILRSLSKPFDLLIADEPFSHLDGKRDEKALALILEVTQKYQAGFWILDLGHIPGLQALMDHDSRSVPVFKEYLL